MQWPRILGFQYLSTGVQPNISNVAEDEEHDCPCVISEFSAHTKEADIEEKSREFVAPNKVTRYMIDDANIHW